MALWLSFSDQSCFVEDAVHMCGAGHTLFGSSVDETISFLRVGYRPEAAQRECHLCLVAGLCFSHCLARVFRLVVAKNTTALTVEDNQRRHSCCACFTERLGQICKSSCSPLGQDGEVQTHIVGAQSSEASLVGCHTPKKHRVHRHTQLYAGY